MVTKEITVEELAQKLYEDDGFCNNIYKKAPVEVLRFYENKAIEIMEHTGYTTDF